MYLGGFVIECLLKAKLLEAYPWLKNARTAAGKSQREKHLWNLCYRSHSLDEILAHLPDVAKDLLTAERRGHSRLYTSLRKICGQWTIYARYSPQLVGIEDARQFLSMVKEVKKWLK
jgi:glutamine synthetase adenylyltransferase